MKIQSAEEHTIHFVTTDNPYEVTYIRISSVSWLQGTTAGYTAVHSPHQLEEEFQKHIASTYQPHVWSVRKDTIYAAITALDLGLKYVRDSLADHDHNIGRTSLGHKLWAETMEAHIRQMEDALKALRNEGTERQTPDQNISITGPGPAEIKDAIVTAISKDKAIPSMDTCCDYAGWGYPDGPSVTWRTVELLRMAALLEVMSNMYTTAAENPNNPSPFPVLDRIMENDNFFDFDDLSSMISNFPPPKQETTQEFSFSKKIISLCDFTGTWAAPYRKNGYSVELIDIKHGKDARLVEYQEIHGILAAPPCTHFAVSGAQYWNQKDNDGRTIEALSIVDACIRLATVTKPKFWVIENPTGRLRKWLGPPQFSFNPCDFGGYLSPEEQSHPSFPPQDAYTKKTYLWGNFIHPTPKPVKPIPNNHQQNNISLPRDANGKILPWTSEETKTIRSITPLGFARAFAEANP